MIEPAMKVMCEWGPCADWTAVKTGSVREARASVRRMGWRHMSVAGSPKRDICPRHVGFALARNRDWKATRR